MSLNQFIQQERHGSFLNGEFVTPRNRDGIDLISPTTKQKWKTIIPATQEDTKRAIEFADFAFRQWRWIPPPTRSKILQRCADLLMENQQLLAEVMTMEMGKTIREGLKEVEYTSGYFHWFAGEAERIYGVTLHSENAEKRIMILPEPIGVAAMITPWNFPLAMGGRKIAAALAAGCTAIIKPSSECPISTLAIAYLLREAGLPPGAINVVVGPEQEIGEVFLKSPVVRKLAFTGSCEVGRYLYAQSGQTLKKLTMELGGHAPVLIFDDALLDRAVEGTIAAKFRNSGQSCIAANRILVQENIYPKFLEKFVARVKSMRVGDPLDPNTDLSNVIHKTSREKVKSQIEDAVSKGAHIVLQGNDSAYPTILTDVTPKMNIFTEETFGPVAPITRFKTMEEAVSLANDSQYGLASYLFTESLTCGHFVIGALEYGIIGLNDGLPSAPQGSFGGIKNSGFGREGGPSGIKEYLVDKYVSIVM